MLFLIFINYRIVISYIPDKHIYEKQNNDNQSNKFDFYNKQFIKNIQDLEENFKELKYQDIS